MAEKWGNGSARMPGMQGTRWTDEKGGRRRGSRRRRRAAAALGRLRLPLLAAVLVPALLFLGAAWLNRGRLLADAADDVARTTGVLREHALRVLDTHEQMLRHLDQHIRGLGWDEIRAVRDRLTEEMRAMLAERLHISALGLADAAGRLWVAAAREGAPPSPEGLSTAHRERDAGTFVSRAYADAATGEFNFGISHRRVVAPGSPFNGTLHVAVAVRYLAGFWARAMSGEAARGATRSSAKPIPIASSPLTRAASTPA